MYLKINSRWINKFNVKINKLFKRKQSANMPWLKEELLKAWYQGQKP